MKQDLDGLPGAEVGGGAVRPKAHHIFGDWRDLRGAIEASDPTWPARSDADREQLWKFAEGVLREYQPLEGACVTCRSLRLWPELYRCADCNTHHCGDCIRPHFESTEPATRHGSLAGPSSFDWTEHEDEISDAITDSLDADWTSRDGARSVVRYLNGLTKAAGQ